MTNEQAIKVLNMVEAHGLADEAKRMAIEVLQAKTDGDLISRRALCQYALNQKDKSVTPNDIMRFPSAEPKTGKWVLKGHLWECDKCGCRINRANPLKGNLWNYSFCPNCGADMREPKLQYGDTDTLQGGLMSAT